VDLNGDGHIDILSGSYSHNEQPMAGLFQVLWGQQDGTWKKATPLLGDNGKPLIITAVRTDDDDLDRICTRAFAVDLDGDGKLDLVSGNFGGTFAFFQGLGEGKFASANSWLVSNDKMLEVSHHSDPFFVDWDGDGDFDLISGDADGSVHWFVNEGSRTQAKWGARQTLYAAQHGQQEHEEDAPQGMRFGEAHINAPGRSVRVFVVDVDGDGKLDLLLGDQATIRHPAKGLTEAAARERLAAWDREMARLSEARTGDEQPSKEQQEAFQKHWEARAQILDEKATGFVWLLRQK
jgi:hypothetical protein